MPEDQTTQDAEKERLLESIRDVAKYGRLVYTLWVDETGVALVDFSPCGHRFALKSLGDEWFDCPTCTQCHA